MKQEKTDTQRHTHTNMHRSAKHIRTQKKKNPDIHPACVPTYRISGMCVYI